MRWETLALDLAEQACARMRQGYAAGETKKDRADWVTDADREIEQLVRRSVQEAFPGHRVVGEEFGATGDGEVTWYVDPVDGTTNFVHGLGWSSFSLAVADRQGAVVGVVADPWRGEVFSAVRGGGARLDGRVVRCSDADDLTGGVVLTELKGTEVWPGMPEMMASLAEAQCVTRIMGSTALALASVAAARCVAMVSHAYNTWDVLAGALIARESGAVVLAKDGTPWTDGDIPPDGLVVGPAALARAVWEMV